MVRLYSWGIFFHMGICFFAMMQGSAGAGEPEAPDRYAAARRLMIERDLRDRDINDAAVLAAMAKVPRHLFVTGRHQSEAYADHPLPIGENQTISQPYIVALMTQSLKLGRHDRVLEIGTGSGYQAAVLAEVAGQIFTIELNKNLAGQAEKLLRSLGYDTVSVRCGDGFFGWPEQAPFDAIMLTCAPGHMPQPLIDQLREGGRIIAPIGGVFQVQALMLGIKKQGRLNLQNIAPVRFVPMRGQAEKSSQ
jgi:protein-L-isoaspartate(D-aspartate) O-methyltransferase